jgi:hypothetical protein
MDNTTQQQAPYWLFNWLESRRLKTIRDVQRELGRGRTLAELRIVAAQWAECENATPVGLNLEAGGGLRQDDALSCPSPTCRRQQVDVLFRHAWHYFDRILLPDGVGQLLLADTAPRNRDYLKEMLLGRIDVAMHIKMIGASDLVHYYPAIKSKFGVIAETIANKNKEWAAAWSDVESILTKDGTIKVEKVNTRQYYVEIGDPNLQINSHIPVELGESDPDSEEIARSVALHQLIHTHIGDLETDLVSAHQLKGALASTVWSQEKVLSYLNKAPTSANVLFHLSFPTLDNVPIKELIEIRQQDRDAFLVFRTSLTEAAKEMLKASENSNAHALADQIKQEVVDPEVSKLRKRLSSARNALATKAAVSIGLGGVATVCSLQLGPLAALAGAAAIPNLASAIAKYRDEKQAIEMSDMYFIWKALRHADS